jgi:hypothetical protein
MPNNTGNMLRATIRSLTEVVGPSVDPNNLLAKEQLTLAVQALTFLEKRLPYLHRRDRFELGAYIATAADCLEGADALDADLVRALRTHTDYARGLHERIDASTETVLAATDVLASDLATLVRALPAVDRPARSRLEAAIIRGAKDVLDLNRAWFLPTGFDRDPEAPDLESVLARSRRDTAQLAVEKGSKND